MTLVVTRLAIGCVLACTSACALYDQTFTTATLTAAEACDDEKALHEETAQLCRGEKADDATCEIDDELLACFRHLRGNGGCDDPLNAWVACLSADEHSCEALAADAADFCAAEKSALLDCAANDQCMCNVTLCRSTTPPAFCRTDCP